MKIIGIAILIIAIQSILAQNKENNRTNFPYFKLENKEIIVTILKPDKEIGYYRSTRFDWSGIIAQVEYNGHTFFQEWEQYDGTINAGKHNPLDNGTGTGTAEEFRNPLGYDEAKVGEPFVKIGVGILEKAENKPHHWAYPYKVIEFGKWKIKTNKDKISFVQDLNTTFGYGYHYEKQIVLRKNSPVVTVLHSLKNTGLKPISTNTYCHNYMRFDNDFIGKNYKIEFSNTCQALDDFGTKATLTGNTFQLNYNLLDAKPVEGSMNVNQSKVFTLSNSKTETSVEVSSNISPNSFYLYIWRMAFCPEPMILIDIKQGETFCWKTEYHFKIKLNS